MGFESVTCPPFSTNPERYFCNEKLGCWLLLTCKREELTGRHHFAVQTPDTTTLNDLFTFFSWFIGSNLQYMILFIFLDLWEREREIDYKNPTFYILCWKCPIHKLAMKTCETWLKNNNNLKTAVLKCCYYKLK